MTRSVSMTFGMHHHLPRIDVLRWFQDVLAIHVYDLMWWMDTLYFFTGAQSNSQDAWWHWTRLVISTPVRLRGNNDHHFIANFLQLKVLICKDCLLLWNYLHRSKDCHEWLKRHRRSYLSSKILAVLEEPRSLLGWVKLFWHHVHLDGENI